MKPIAVVTGGSQGLGFSIAEELIRHGYHAVIMGRRKDALEDAVARLGDATGIAVDIGVPSDVVRAFAEVDTLGGPLSVLVNNAGIFIAYPLEEGEDALIQSMVQTNLVGPILCTREAAKRMCSAATGDIVNISSEAAGPVFPLLAVYSATKAGLEQLTKVLNAEYRKTDIRAITVRVGAMKTEGALGGMTGGFAQRFGEAMVESGAAFLSGKGMTPQAVAKSIVAAIAAPRELRTEFVHIRSA